MSFIWRNFFTRNLWIGSAIVNNAIIIPTNFYSVIEDLRSGDKNTTSDQEMVKKKNGEHKCDLDDAIILSVILAISAGAVFMSSVVAKCGYYSVMGPIGTYRIALACHNAAYTHDQKYIFPVTKFFYFTEGDEAEKYMMKPMGNVSWFPKKLNDHINR